MHQRLLHMNDTAIKTAHEHVEGVPDFSGSRGFDILDNCQVCIQAKMTKSPAGKHSLSDRVKQAYQGLYMDFFRKMNRDDRISKESMASLLGFLFLMHTPNPPW